MEKLGMRIGRNILIFGLLSFVVIGIFRKEMMTDSFAAVGLNKIDQVGTIFTVSGATGTFMMEQAFSRINPSKSRPLRVLELGSGTGSVTKMIIKACAARGDEYTLDLVEIDESFCADLEKLFGENKSVKIHHKDFLDFKSNESYDIVISTLPMNSKFFDDESTKAIFKKVKKMTSREGVFVFVGYVGTKTLSRLFYRLTTPDKLYKKIILKERYLEQFVKQYGVNQSIVFKNIPPIWVTTCVFESHYK